MAPKYSLTYFPIAGRAEAARLMFLVAGVEFTDNHISFEEWPSIKSNVKRFPMNQMPTMEVDGRVICQSAAIYCYLANEFGFYGANNKEKASIDQIIATFNDYFADVVKIMFAKDLSGEEKNKQYNELFAQEVTKKKFSFIATFLKENKKEKSFFVGDKISLADFVFLAQDDTIGKSYPQYLDPYPELKELLERIKAVEAIKKHRETRKY